MGDDIRMRALVIRIDQRVTPELSADRVASPSENKSRKLIERVTDLHAHQNERGDHQIEAEMHGSLEGDVSKIVLRRPSSEAAEATLTRYTWVIWSV